MELECKFTQRWWFGAPETKYTCEINEAFILEPNTNIVAVKGQHHEGKKHQDVETVKIFDSMVEYFPRNLHRMFPNLRCLQIEGCGLKAIYRRDLIGFENLEMISLESNKLTSVPNNLFTNMRKLTQISFADNDLKCINSQLLSPILNNGLTRVSFRSNKFIDACFDINSEDGNVKSLPQLMRIIDAECNEPNEEAPFRLSSMENDDFWYTNSSSDFTIIVDSVKFRVHKRLLGIQSSAFAALFERKNSLRKLRIEGLSVKIFEEFLRFLYTGRLSEETDVLKLFKVASKWNVPGLKWICEERIFQQLDASNVCEIFNLGHKYSSEDMKVMAFNEMRNLFPELKLADSLIKNPRELMKLINMKLCTKNIS